MSFGGVVTCLVVMNACRAGAMPGPASGPGLHEVFPGVRADVSGKLVEFDATITPMLTKDDRAPLFFLEVLACSPETRAHETLVVTTVKPSHIHAALLLIGLKPGTPGKWKLENNQLVPVDPTGDRVSLRYVYVNKDGTQAEQDPLDWVVRVKEKDSFVESEAALAKKQGRAAPGWVFAGSRFVKRVGDDGVQREVYDADGSGTIIGLTTFGSEVIGWSRTISPDANVEEPDWIADFSKTPPPETKVIVRVRPEATPTSRQP